MVDAAARAPALLTIIEPGQPVPHGWADEQLAALGMIDDGGALTPGHWLIRQVLDDYDRHHDYAIIALLDLKATDESEKPSISIVSVGP